MTLASTLAAPAIATALSVTGFVHYRQAVNTARSVAPYLDPYSEVRRNGATNPPPDAPLYNEWGVLVTDESGVPMTYGRAFPQMYR